MSDGLFAVVLIGDPRRTHGYVHHDTVVPAVATARFDNGTDTWAVTTTAGQTLTARVLVDATPCDDDAVAVHGIPNRFRIPGPHTARQARYVGGLIEVMQRGGSTRIEARSRIRVRRLLGTRGPSRFYLTGCVSTPDEIYDGPAVLTYHGQDHQARVRLTGQVNPIDGQYHWQGTLYADLPGDRVTGSPVSIRIGEHAAEARISEQTPWGALSVFGAAGYPPFLLASASV